MDVMSTTLQTALERISKLSPADQDVVGGVLLREIDRIEASHSAERARFVVRPIPMPHLAGLTASEINALAYADEDTAHLE